MTAITPLANGSVLVGSVWNQVAYGAAFHGYTYDSVSNNSWASGTTAMDFPNGSVVLNQLPYMIHQGSVYGFADVETATVGGATYVTDYALWHVIGSLADSAYPLVYKWQAKLVGAASNFVILQLKKGAGAFADVGSLQHLYNALSTHMLSGYISGCSFGKFIRTGNG